MAQGPVQPQSWSPPQLLTEVPLWLSLVLRAYQCSECMVECLKNMSINPASISRSCKPLSRILPTNHFFVVVSLGCLFVGFFLRMTGVTESCPCIFLLHFGCSLRTRSAVASNSSINKYRIFFSSYAFPPSDELRACAKRNRERTKDTKPHLTQNLLLCRLPFSRFLGNTVRKRMRLLTLCVTQARMGAKVRVRIPGPDTYGVLLAVFVLGTFGNFSSGFLSLYLIILFITDFLT